MPSSITNGRQTGFSFTDLHMVFKVTPRLPFVQYIIVSKQPHLTESHNIYKSLLASVVVFFCLFDLFLFFVVALFCFAFTWSRNRGFVKALLSSLLLLKFSGFLTLFVNLPKQAFYHTILFVSSVISLLRIPSYYTDVI